MEQCAPQTLGKENLKEVGSEWIEKDSKASCVYICCDKW